jgi:hypothetical protein
MECGDMKRELQGGTAEWGGEEMEGFAHHHQRDTEAF